MASQSDHEKPTRPSSDLRLIQSVKRLARNRGRLNCRIESIICPAGIKWLFRSQQVQAGEHLFTKVLVPTVRPTSAQRPAKPPPRPAGRGPNMGDGSVAALPLLILDSAVAGGDRAGWKPAPQALRLL